MRPATRPSPPTSHRHFPTDFDVLISLAASAAAAADEPAKKPDSPLVKLLRGGRVPAERQGTIIDMIGKRGNAADLDFLLDQAPLRRASRRPTASRRSRRSPRRR